MRVLIPVAALLFSVSLLLMGNGLQGVLLPVRAAEQDFSAFSIGIMGSGYFVGFAAGCLLGPFVLQRVGHIRTFAALVAIASALPLIHGMFTSVIVWWFARAFTGFCFAGLYMVIESWLNEKASNENRGYIFSVYTVINLTVITLGQMLIIIDNPSPLFLFALASVLVSISAVPVALTKAVAPTAPERVRLRLLHLYRISPVGVFGCFGIGLANGSFWSLAPVFAQSDEQGPSAAAIFMSVAVIAGAISQWPIGWMSDRMDRRRVIIVLCVGAAIAGCALYGMAFPTQLAILAGVAGFGAFAFPLYSICAAHLNDFVEDGGFVEASGGLLLVYAGGAIVGPLIASAGMRSLGVPALFGFTVIVHLTVGVFTLYRMARRSAPVEGDRVGYTEAVIMSQTVSDIDAVADEAEAPSGGAQGL
jgi:MFS family permease